MTTEDTKTTDTESPSSEADALNFKVLVQLAMTISQLADQTDDDRIKQIASVALSLVEKEGLHKLLASGVLQVAIPQQTPTPQTSPASTYDSPYDVLMQKVADRAAL